LEGCACRDPFTRSPFELTEARTAMTHAACMRPVPMAVVVSWDGGPPALSRRSASGPPAVPAEGAAGAVPSTGHLEAVPFRSVPFRWVPVRPRGREGGGGARAVGVGVICRGWGGVPPRRTTGSRSPGSVPPHTPRTPRPSVRPIVPLFGPSSSFFPNVHSRIEFSGLKFLL